MGLFIRCLNYVIEVKLTDRYDSLTLSEPQDVTNVNKARSRLRVLGRKSSYLAGVSIFFFMVL